MCPCPPNMGPSFQSTGRYTSVTPVFLCTNMHWAVLGKKKSISNPDPLLAYARQEQSNRARKWWNRRDGGYWGTVLEYSSLSVLSTFVLEGA